MHNLLLAADLGATKVDLAVFSPEAGHRAPLAQVTRLTARYLSFEALAGEFLAQVGHPVQRAVLAVAGPVVNHRITITNMPWEVDGIRTLEALGLSSVVLLNDLEATALALPLLGPGDLHTLKAGHPVPEGAIAVIAPGTGLGEAFLVWDGARYVACASEGGHASFAPTNAFEMDLLQYLQQRFDYVSCEMICSGLGLPNIYAFLKESGRAREPGWLARRLAAAPDPTPVIIDAALDPTRSCEICRTALERFAAILGSEAGNLALKVLATGGVYVGGGIPPRLLPVLERGQFWDAFWRKGQDSDLLRDIPVHVILNPQAALLGAASHGLSPIQHP
jgi:glucokinase